MLADLFLPQRLRLMTPPRDNDEFAQPRGSFLPWGQFTDCSGRGRQNTDTRAVCRLFQHSGAGARELDKLLPDRTLSRKLPLLGSAPHKLRCYRTNCRQFAVCDTPIWIWRSHLETAPTCLCTMQTAWQFTDCSLHTSSESSLLTISSRAVYCCQFVEKEQYTAASLCRSVCVQNVSL